ncbi:VWA domain-containing protein [Noviherbaspirillum sp. UKPF54]|uniref:vWA domain-containing protein n=1 Tax=Noviherbaspirillum sp. UKPF54 TaxID=2601898 RepID=UPI0011B1A852|nr:VWA domain-containing protein [Noviherbaspirillum sp. UKPF54]QDZ26581.1 VWA domain-containing protein [Noviherbaspirillum sp. UKPF54]
MPHELAISTDLIDNPSPRCPCMVVLDTSGSMGGGVFSGLFSSGNSNTPIAQLNKGMSTFLEALQADEIASYSVDVGVITAGGTVQEVLPFTTAVQIENIQPFQANGQTPLGGAVELALKRLEERKAEYKRNGVAYYQPWLVVISDGEPSDKGTWQHAAQIAKTLSNERKLVSLMVGVEGADMNVLAQASNKPALKLDGLKFSEFFEWLSASMSRVSASTSTSASVQLPSVDSWASI